MRLGNEHISFEVTLEEAFALDARELRLTLGVFRPPRLAPWWTLQSRLILKACACSTTLCKT